MNVVQWLADKLRRRMNHGVYRKLYEAHAAQNPGADVVGGGDYDLIGRIELDLLRAEGLAPAHTLFDLGCGNGRLAMHAVPYLCAGAYVGADISPRLLERAKERLAQVSTTTACRVSWQLQVSENLAQPPHSVDMLCAFSVFTHIEHEDTFRYLGEARRVVRPGGKMVFSCLPLELPAAKHIFQQQAALDFTSRWSQVRSIVTSRDLMSELARMAGWVVARWYPGDMAIISNGSGQAHALGQSCCILVAPQE